jgi:hypothetical protein
MRQHFAKEMPDDIMFHTIQTLNPCIPVLQQALLIDHFLSDSLDTTVVTVALGEAAKFFDAMKHRSDMLKSIPRTKPTEFQKYETS